MNSGEVPGLFDSEEQDSIIMEVKQLASEQGVPDNRIAVFQFFIDVSVGSCLRILKTSCLGMQFDPFAIVYQDDDNTP